MVPYVRLAGSAGRPKDSPGSSTAGLANHHAAGPGPRAGPRWALEAIVVQHLTVARVAEVLAVSWNTANDAVVADGQRVLINDPGSITTGGVIGWIGTVGGTPAGGDKYVTFLIGVTLVRDGTGRPRLLDMISGQSKESFRPRLADRPQAWGDQV